MHAESSLELHLACCTAFAAHSYVCCSVQCSVTPTTNPGGLFESCNS